MVSPPLPMSSPILSGSILIDEIRGAYCESSSRARREHVVHGAEDERAGAVGLGQRVAQDLERDARDLDVHLQGGDALSVPATLKSMSPR